MCLPTVFGSDLQLYSVVTQQWKRKAPAVCTTTTGISYSGVYHCSLLLCCSALVALHFIKMLHVRRLWARPIERLILSFESCVMRRVRLFYIPSHGIYGASWIRILCTMYDLMLSFTTYVIGISRLRVLYILLYLGYTRYLDSHTQLAASTGCINVVWSMRFTYNRDWFGRFFSKSVCALRFGARAPSYIYVYI